MGRAPCCEKMGLKRGPWTPEEDRILIDHINTYGHANWRALPKQAGLLRCGKSCRLRWTNYLRPDIKRGNLTREEEDAIINLHEMLGNRWSAIAARLPGRTDNEIKNVWHTHLKKRLPQNKQGAHNNNNNPKRNNKKQTKLDIVVDASKSNQDDKQEDDDDDGSQSHQQCSSDMSSLSTSSDNNHEHNNNNNSSSSSSIATTTNNNNHDMSINNDNDDDGGDSAENNLALDEDFWMEVLSCDNNSSESTTTTSGVLDSNISGGADYRVQVPFSPVLGSEEGVLSGSSLSMCDEMDFWYDVYSRAEDISELLEL